MLITPLEQSNMQAVLTGTGLLIEFLSSQIDSFVCCGYRYMIRKGIMLEFIPSGQLTPLFIPWACLKPEPAAACRNKSSCFWLGLLKHLTGEAHVGCFLSSPGPEAFHSAKPCGNLCSGTWVQSWDDAGTALFWHEGWM